MIFDIKQFRNSMIHGPASSAYFDVKIKAPDAFYTFAGFDQSTAMKELSLRCYESEIPGKNLRTISHAEYGPSHGYVVGADYNEINLSFYVTDDLYARKFFTLWQEFISDNEPISASDSGSHDVEFYDFYVGTLMITTYTSSGFPNHTTICEEAFPVAVQSIPLSWESQDNVMKVNVAFKYRYQRTIYYPVAPGLPAILAQLPIPSGIIQGLDAIDIIEGTIDQARETIDAILRRGTSIKNIIKGAKDRVDENRNKVRTLGNKVKSIPNRVKQIRDLF